jgi:hypothetical protein
MPGVIEYAAQTPGERFTCACFSEGLRTEGERGARVGRYTASEFAVQPTRR